MSDLEAYNEERISQYAPIQGAAIEGNMELVIEQLQNGANIDEMDNYYGYTPICMALKHNHIELVKYLIDNGANVHDLGLPFHLASEDTHLEIVKYLIENNGYGVDKRNAINDCTLIFVAFQRNHIEVVKYLLEKGADIDYRDCYNEHAPLDFATDDCHLEVVKYFHESGVDLNRLDRNGNTLACVALRLSHMEALRYLLENGFNVNQEDRHGQTLLFLGVRKDLNLVKYLVEKGAAINHVDYSNELNPLRAALQEGRIEVVEYLLDNGADANHVYAKGKSPIHVVLLEYCLEPYEDFTSLIDRITQLLEYGADVTKTDKEGRNALSIAIKSGEIEALHFLLEYLQDHI